MARRVRRWERLAGRLGCVDGCMVVCVGRWIRRRVAAWKGASLWVCVASVAAWLDAETKRMVWMDRPLGERIGEPIGVSG